jgi:hypothetical protein
MKRSYLVATVATILSCLGQIAAAEDGGPVYIGKTAPYTDAAMIKANIVNECDLPASQMKLLREQAQAAGVSLVEDESAVASKKGRVLLVEIFNAVSQGNAFIGHGKQVVLKGKLLENGAEIGNFTATRGSMGGAFAGYKSSCAVLHRCQNALAKDILTWLKSPAKDSRIGE